MTDRTIMDIASEINDLADFILRPWLYDHHGKRLETVQEPCAFCGQRVIPRNEGYRDDLCRKCLIDSTD